jgi:hypothetical protein
MKAPLAVGPAIVSAIAAYMLAPTAQAAACPGAAEGYARLATPEAEIAYRWEPGTLKVGQFFKLEVVACRVPGAEAVQSIVVDAQMPAHGHGMNYRPTMAQTGAGSFRFSGLMLHMPGRWRLTVDLVQGERRTRLAHDIELRP